MTLSNANTQVIIDLNKILNSNDATEIKRMQQEFESNGWCFIILPSELIPTSVLTHELSEFFQQADGTKRRYTQRVPIYGYSKVDHKEGIKLLTGSYYGKFANKSLIPRQLVHPLNYLSQAFDVVTKRLIEILDQHCVFQSQPSLSTLIEEANLPPKDEHFGMLDIVSYFNDKNGFQPPINGQSTEEVNCVPHYDPGLLSISVMSTHEGLQLKDMTTNQWIDGPLQPNIGVIWLGEAAARVTQNRLKPGIHRVIYPQKAERRLTVWYEVCTITQLKNLSDEKQNKIMADGSVTFDNLPGSDPITVRSGETKLEFLRRVEMARGLSMSKSGPPRYQLEKHDISYSTNDSKAE
ncbi:unnamed protein product [Adineta steineri]|uniref:Isopenicillin N synthase-like Fe(2+) 2OG dioxygenase domain-containing protein n=1 Tax=Adineta steineri TaxID=433720 RepID=A0A814TFR4_9BILA|nr:unnamed protein product [Adineta steineri]CAF1223590.1 unnamed protein product [Adineta steineri]